MCVVVVLLLQNCSARVSGDLLQAVHETFVERDDVNNSDDDEFLFSQKHCVSLIWYFVFFCSALLYINARSACRKLPRCCALLSIERAAPTRRIALARDVNRRKTMCVRRLVVFCCYLIVVVILLQKAAVCARASRRWSISRCCCCCFCFVLFLFALF